MLAIDRAQLVLLALISLGIAFAADARTFKPGSLKARWPIKTSLAARASVSSPPEVPIADLIVLPDAPGMAARYGPAVTHGEVRLPFRPAGLGGEVNARGAAVAALPAPRVC